MTSDEISAEITYQKPGTQPPIFVAGTFSDPPWHPYEMDYVLREDGEHLFRKEVYGKPGSEVQYKFRIGEGDWWDLQQGAPTVTDASGNTNHVLEIKSSPKPTTEETPQQDQGETNESEEQTPSNAAKANGTQLQAIVDEDTRTRSGANTPVSANVAAEVADSAELLHEGVPDRESAGGDAHVQTPPKPIKPILEEEIRLTRSDAGTPEPAKVAAEVADSAELLHEDVPQHGGIHVETSKPVKPSGAQLESIMNEEIRLARSDAGTPEPAKVAAEVADSAELLHEDVPEHGGIHVEVPSKPVKPSGAQSESIRNEQIGLERSGAGTPETAKVAAEVADSAELLHEDVPEHGGIHVDISPEPVKPSGTPLRSVIHEEISLTRSGAGTPEAAKVAAEVADSAEQLHEDVPEHGGIHVEAPSEPTKPSGAQLQSVINEEIRLTRSGAGTPETAKVAAEVADSAALLNEDVPDRVPDDSGIKERAPTPMGENAETAAEVADTAEKLDRVDEILLASPPLEESQPFSPSEEPEAYLEHKPPLFAHELAGVPSPDGEIREPELEEEHYHADRSPIEDIDPDEVDLNDPTLERFPSNREEIIEKVRKLETSLTEDQPSFEGAPPSPVVNSPSPGVHDVTDYLLAENTPAVPRQPLKHLDVLKSSHGSAVSLQSISEAEEPEEPVTEDDAATQPAIVFTNTLKPKPGPLTLDESHEDEGISLKDSVSPRTAAPPPAATMVAPEDTPSAREAEPVSETETTPTEQQRDANGADNKEPSAPEEQAAPAPEVAAPDQFDDVGRAGKGSPEVQITGDSSAEPSARATGADVDGEPQQARKRTTQPAEDVQTATSPVSTRSTETTGAIQPHRAEGWFRAFFRVLFVDWIGGFISKMYGGTRRNTTLLTASTAAIFMGFGFGWWTMNAKMEGPVSAQ